MSHATCRQPGSTALHLGALSYGALQVAALIATSQPFSPSRTLYLSRSNLTSPTLHDARPCSTYPTSSSSRSSRVRATHRSHPIDREGFLSPHSTLANATNVSQTSTPPSSSPSSTSRASSSTSVATTSSGSSYALRTRTRSAAAAGSKSPSHLRPPTRIRGWRS